MDGGIKVTASHNPTDYNGMKLVRGGARPISGDTGLKDIQRLVEENVFPAPGQRGRLSRLSILEPYIDHLLTYIEPCPTQAASTGGQCGQRRCRACPRCHRRPVSGAGRAGALIKIHHEPDGTFPHGIPNPLLPENRAATSRGRDRTTGPIWASPGMVISTAASSSTNRASSSKAITSSACWPRRSWPRNPGEKIIHDPRLTWNTMDMVTQAGGIPIQSKTGHAFIKERMRAENAVYGGEMSAHHYFRDFAYCDSGMIPWLLVAELMSTSGKPLSTAGRRARGALSVQRRDQLPGGRCHGRHRAVESHFAALGPVIDRTDGLSLDFGQWRFNLRASNTEPLLRLNVESRGDVHLVADRVREIESIIGAVC